MANNLPTVEKNLRSMAKRSENVKYSLGLAILFLLFSPNFCTALVMLNPLILLTKL